MSEVPFTLTELKAAFGKDMLLITLGAFDIDNDDTRPTVLNMPQDELVAVADEWRDSNPGEAKTIGAHAHRALAKLPGEVGASLPSIKSDVASELSRVPEVGTSKARYLVDVFDLLQGRPLEDMEKCLKSIVAFGNGE